MFSFVQVLDGWGTQIRLAPTSQRVRCTHEAERCARPRGRSSPRRRRGRRRGSRHALASWLARKEPRKEGIVLHVGLRLRPARVSWRWRVRCSSLPLRKKRWPQVEVEWEEGAFARNRGKGPVHREHEVVTVGITVDLSSHLPSTEVVSTDSVLSFPRTGMDSEEDSSFRSPCSCSSCSSC